VLVPTVEFEIYKKAINDAALDFKLIMEHDVYEKIIYKNVNNYICLNMTKKIKQKGFFVHEPPLGGSVDELVIAKALEQYYVNGIEPKEYISNPTKYNLTIFDYCKSNKISRDYTVYHNGNNCPFI